jgi:histidine triad (HIT) family protein
MFNHAPPGYECPFCALASGKRCASLHSTADDIILRDQKIMALVASHWWKKNPGHVLVVPVRHFENLYDLPDEVGSAIHAASKSIALAMKRAYRCEGISTRQHNEPAGYQEVWHYHLHIFPRFADDNLYAEDGSKSLIAPPIRSEYAQRLRESLRHGA